MHEFISWKQNKWEWSCEGDDLTVVGCSVTQRRSDLSLCFITVLYKYCRCCLSLVTSDKLDAVFGYRVCDMAVYRKSAKLRRCNCSSVSHSLSSFVWKQAGYTATLVACGWAGAVLEKVTRASGQEPCANKAQKRRKSKKGTNRLTDGPTNRRTDIAGCRVA